MPHSVVWPALWFYNEIRYINLPFTSLLYWQNSLAHPAWLTHINIRRYSDKIDKEENARSRWPTSSLYLQN